jgi:hypothetical protein
MHAGLLFLGQIAVGYKTDTDNRFSNTYLMMWGGLTIV